MRFSVISARRYIGSAVINVGRRILAGTWLANSQLSSKLVAQLVKWAYGLEPRIVSYKGMAIEVPFDSVLTNAISAGYYESLELDLFRAACSRAKCVLDIGSNIGLYCIAAASALQKDGQVFAFEPEHSNALRIKRNLGLNKSIVNGSAEVFEIAIGDSDGELNLWLAPESTSRHSASWEQSGGKNGILVQKTSLDNFVESRGLTVDVVKIDVEGYEAAVVAGGINVLRRDRPVLFMEFAPEALRNCGFSPWETLELLFEIYPNRYLIQEVRKNIVSFERTNIAENSTQIFNLVFTARELSTDHGMAS